MKELGKYDYLVKSQEFHIFARDKVDVEKGLGILSKQTPMQILTKYRETFNINENQDISDISQYKERILDFQAFIKKCLSVMNVSLDNLTFSLDSKEAIEEVDEGKRCFGSALQVLDP